MSDTDVLMIVKIVLVQRIISLDGHVTYSLRNIYQTKLEPTFAHLAATLKGTLREKRIEHRR